MKEVSSRPEGFEFRQRISKLPATPTRQFASEGLPNGACSVEWSSAMVKTSAEFVYYVFFARKSKQKKLNRKIRQAKTRHLWGGFRRLLHLRASAEKE